VRTLDAATPLADLNFGRGVADLEGQPDFRITTAAGAFVDVDIDGAVTIGDVIDRINDAAAAAGVGLTAGLAPIGNGIRLTSNGGSGAAPTVTLLNLSTAAVDLGLTDPASAANGELLGRDVNPTRTPGIIGALMELEQALRRDDTQGISAAGNRLDEMRGEVTRVHGIVGARSQVLHTKLSQMQFATATTEELLSQVRDLDYPDAITRMQSALAQVQANLQTAPALLNLSLLDFLR
jgi:flagellin-like hook-associated protein FlgL